MKFVVFIIIAVLTALVVNVRFVGSDNKKYVPYYMPYFVQPRRSTDIYTIAIIFSLLMALFPSFRQPFVQMTTSFLSGMTGGGCFGKNCGGSSPPIVG